MGKVEIGRDLEIRRRSSKRSDDDSSIYQARNILKVWRIWPEAERNHDRFPTKADYSTKVFARSSISLFRLVHDLSLLLS